MVPVEVQIREVRQGGKRRRDAAPQLIEMQEETSQRRQLCHRIGNEPRQRSPLQGNIRHSPHCFFTITNKHRDINPASFSQNFTLIRKHNWQSVTPTIAKRQEILANNNMTSKVGTCVAEHSLEGARARLSACLP